MPRVKRRIVDPLDEALASGAKHAAQVRVADHELWQAWKADPSPENTHVIMQRFEPLLQKKQRDYRAPHVQPAAIRANMKLQVIEALKSFDPSRGAALPTHVENHLKKTMRFNVKQQNNAYIPEGKAGLIGPIGRATQDLQEDLGYEPNDSEIADQVNLGLPPARHLTAAKIKTIRSAQMKDIVGSSFESDPVPRAVSLDRQNMPLLRLALTEDQREVFDHLYGLNGKPLITSTADLAKRLGKSSSQVSRMRTAILNVHKRYAG